LHAHAGLFTEREVERLMECARKHGRYGHRDATTMLVAYRHGLRASEVCDLQWQQIELAIFRIQKTASGGRVCRTPQIAASWKGMGSRPIQQASPSADAGMSRWDTSPSTRRRWRKTVGDLQGVAHGGLRAHPDNQEFRDGVILSA
jgi:integrase